MNNKLTVTAVKHVDIRDKEQLYVIMKNEETNEKVVINVGQKTFDSVNELTGVTPKSTETTKLFIEDLETKQPTTVQPTHGTHKTDTQGARNRNRR